jgi:hypothetical protein
MSNQSPRLARRRHLGLGLLLGGAIVLSFGSAGCGMVTAVTNPSAAFAIQEPANLGVVVRRAEVARATSEQVDRLLGNTALGDDSAWLAKVALKPDEATALMKAASNENVYVGTQTRVVQAEAWAHGLANLCGDGSAHPNLVAASGPATAKLYSAIVAERKAIGKLKMAAGVEEAAADADGVAADKKAAHEAKAEQLEAEADKLQTANEAKVDQLVEALKKPSAATGPLKDKLKAVVTALVSAVGDARNANSAAMLGYPLAMSGITGELQKAAPRFVADVIEDKTGTRPDTSTLKPDVKLEGTDVKLTLNGLTKEQLGSLNLGDVVSETTSRLSGYVKLVLSLTVYASETQDLLSLQEKLLEAYLDGLGGPGTPVDLSSVQVQAAAAAAKAEAKPEGAKGKRWPGGLLIASACTPAKDDDTVVAAAVVPPAGGAAGAAAAEPAKTAEAKQASTAAEPAKPAEEKPAEPAEPTEPAEPAEKAAEEPAEEPVEDKTASAEEPKPASGGSTLRTVGFISLATGGAGLIAGGIFGVIAATKHKDLTSACEGTNCPPSQHDDVQTYRTMGNVSTAALIGGGAAAAIGLVLIVAAPSPSGPAQEQAKPTKPKPKIVPYVGLGTAGAMGRF